MIPLRSGQSLSGQWREVNKHGAAGQFTRYENINALLAQSGGRRFVLVGGGSTKLREYDQTKDYSDGDEVLVSPDNDAVTTGVTDPDSGLAVKAIPGVYKYVSAASSTVRTEGEDPKYHIPCWPPPMFTLETVYTDGLYPDLTDDASIATGKIFWFLIAAYPYPLCATDAGGASVPRIVNAGPIPDTEGE